MSQEQQNANVALPLVYAVFLFSGIAALLYQLLWQRTLFAIYGTNTESVSVVVAAFMLGLGVGSIAGGQISRRVKLALPLVFAAIQIAIGVFGLASLGLFRLVGQATAGVSVWMTGILAFALVALPTCLMGATLPILVAYAVDNTGNVGESVGMLYFVNTLGSAIGCFLAAALLFRTLGMTGSVRFAAALNLVCASVVAVAWLEGRDT